MKYIFTDFYEDFACIGEKCIDSCCKDWDILIDKATYEKYAALEEPLRSNICHHIEETERGYKIILDSEGRCPFLNQQNLCDIYSKLSPDAMSYVCKTYPRKTIQYYDVIFATVSVSCPEVARIILEKETPIRFCFLEDQDEDVVENADWTLYNELINGLVVTTDILQDRDLELWQRLQLVLIVTDSIQAHVEKNDLASLREEIKCFQDKKYRKRVYENNKCNPVERMESWKFIHTLFECIISTKNISDGAKTFLDRICFIDAGDEQTYQMWKEEFKSMDSDNEYENLAVQFVFEYYMDALKGKSLYINIVKMLVLLILIRSQEVIDYHVKKKLTVEDRALIIAKTSEVMEHSEMLELLVEDIVNKNKMTIILLLLGALS